MKNNDMGKKKVKELSKILENKQSVEFVHNNLFYELFDGSEGGYIVNVYSSDKKDEDGCYLDEYLVDGGLCTGSSKDAIEFML